MNDKMILAMHHQNQKDPRSGASSRRSPTAIEAFQQALIGLLRGGDCRKPFSRHSKVALRTTSTLRCWIAEMRLHESLFFHPVERGVKSAGSRFASSAFCYLVSNRNAVCVFAEAQNSQEHDLFKLS